MRSLLWNVSCILLFIAVPATVYLYSYPIFNGCSFPSEYASAHPSPWWKFGQYLADDLTSEHYRAPFRLLALGDPQLEGDSSLPDRDNGYFPSVQNLWSGILAERSLKQRMRVVHTALKGLIIEDIVHIVQSCRKQVDLLGNDYYLAHIYRSMYMITKPTHVTVLGDLLGSQWVDDEEFERRGWRYWQRVFRHAMKVDDDVTKSASIEVLAQDKSWGRRLINVVGNHDIGYAGDITDERMERFERVFGKSNWEVRFQLCQASTINTTSAEDGYAPELRIVVLNSLNLDTPALDADLQSYTYNYLNNIISTSRPVEDRASATILLTHLPLHKEYGLCTDGPYFSFHSDEHGGGVKEQNHLSYDVSVGGILEGMYGMSGNQNGPGQGFGRNGIILTGHDHEGCDVFHHLPEKNHEPRRWQSARWSDADMLRNRSIPGIREVTVRSMMGDFGGNAGLLSAWFDYDIQQWRFEYSTCTIGIQHIWWAVHVLDIITIGLLSVLLAWNAFVDPNMKEAEPTVVGKKVQDPSIMR